MDNKDYIIDKLAKKNAQLEVTNLEFEYAYLVLKEENDKLKNEIEKHKQTKETKNSEKTKEV